MLARTWSKTLGNWQLLVLFAPVFAYFLIFKYLPMYGVTIAFKDYRVFTGITGSEWIGFTHFRDLFSGYQFMQVLRNTLVISVLKLVFVFPAPILLAVLLNELRSSWYRRTVQTISYLPHFLSWVVLAGIVYEFLSLRGPLNYLLDRLGQPQVLFLAEPGLFRGILVTTALWQEVGWNSIIYLAAISTINPELFEAATIDGAGRFQRIIYVTIPSIMPIITLMLILRIGRLMEAGFDQVFNLYNELVYNVGDIIDTYVYRAGLLQFNFSFSTAAGLFKNVVGFTLLLIANRIIKRTGQHGIW